MKKRNLVLVFAFVFILASCQELIGTFTASVNGVAWDAATFGAVKNGNQYNITGNKGNSAIVITIPGTSQGTYTINPLDTALDAVAYLPDYNNSDSSFIATQGSVNLTKVSTGHLTGTFNVYAKSTKNANDSILLTGQFSNILSN